jgi:hypothetical protein
LVVLGNRHNVGQGTQLTAFDSQRHTPGYDLDWNAAGDRIDSITVNGVGTGMSLQSINGLPVIRVRGPWDEPSGYAGYAGGKDLGLDFTRCSGTFFDAPREPHYSKGSDMNTADASQFRIGPGAEEIIFMIGFFTEQWMNGLDLTTGPLDFHSPNVPLTGRTFSPPSPIYLNVTNGVMEVVERTTANRQILLNNNPQNSDLNGFGGAIGSVALEPFGGGPNLFTVRLKIDPTSSDRYVELYKTDPNTGALSQVFADTAARGYWFADGDALATQANGAAYPIAQWYNYKISPNGAAPGQADANGIINNRDRNPARVGFEPEVRESNFLLARGATSPAYTVQDASDTLAEAAGL